MLSEDGLFFGLHLTQDGSELSRPVRNRKASGDLGMGMHPCEEILLSVLSLLVVSLDAQWHGMSCRQQPL